MPPTKPIIGITARHFEGGRSSQHGYFCEATYCEVISRAGGTPVVLPCSKEKSVLNNYLNLCHGLLLSGGGDFCEKFYKKPLSQRERESLSGVDATRDTMETYLVRKAISLKLPILGICRGAQVMNIACGGTLFPDISNHQHSNPYAFAHKIQWMTHDRLWNALKFCDRVNSSHHQAVDAIANGFTIAAKSSDGFVEAIEMKGDSFVCGVQFHPERLVCRNQRFINLFKVFVKEAQSYQLAS